jgi:hypothetical protein
MAVDVEEVGAFAPGDERRLTADRSEGAGGTVDAAGNDTAGPLKGLTTADAREGHGDFAFSSLSFLIAA